MKTSIRLAAIALLCLMLFLSCGKPPEVEEETSYYFQLVSLEVE